MSKKGGYYCAFKHCRGLSRRDKRSFFRFPKDPQRSKQWVKACERNDLLEKTPIELFNSYRVCAKHFTDSMFLNDLKNRLQPNSVPVHLESREDSDDTFDNEKKNDAFLEDPISKILSNCILQKISADEFFKATGICIQEPVSTIKGTEEYLEAPDITNAAENTMGIDISTDNTMIDIHNDDSMAIDINNESVNSFSADPLSYLDLIDSLPASMINVPDSELSSVEISDLSFMDSEKTLCLNKIPANILEETNDISILNNVVDIVKTIDVMTQTTTETFKYELTTNQIKSDLIKQNTDKIVNTEMDYIVNKSDESTQTEFYMLKNNLEESTQTEFSFLKYKLNKKKLKKILQNRRLKIRELKHKIKHKYVNAINSITLEQYELLTEKFFPKETSDFIKIQAQLFKQKSNDRRYSI